MLKAHQKLKAWQLAMTLVEQIYRETRTFPDFERYGLSRQMQKAAVSIPSNIAEGAARDSSKEFRRFLLIARGSLAELETQLQLAARLGYCITEGNTWKNIHELYGLLNGLVVRHKLNL